MLTFPENIRNASVREGEDAYRPHQINHLMSVFLAHSKAEIASDPGIRKLVQEQTTQWSEMVERHRKEEWKSMKQHVTDQEEILKQLLTTTQATQVRQLEAKHER